MKLTCDTERLLELYDCVENRGVLAATPTQFYVDSFFSDEFVDVIGDAEVDIYSIELDDDGLCIDSEYIFKPLNKDSMVLAQFMDKLDLVIITISKSEEFLISRTRMEEQ